VSSATPPLKRSRALRVLSTLLMVAGVLLLLWAVVVWRWNDPVTGLYTRWEQRQLRSSFEDAVRSAASGQDGSPDGAGSTTGGPRAPLPERARRYWRDTGTGRPVARLTIDRLGLDVIVVKGTDSASLKKGPGLDGRTAMPGEGELVYIAGHRTTYLAPFSRIDRLRKGDPIRLSTPYARFEYVVTGHRIVRADDLSVLESPGHEVLALQACHPRFFATERYIVYALPRTRTAGSVEAGPVASSGAGTLGT
jgi:sortase A